jgi:signal transduction histidine kinase
MIDSTGLKPMRASRRLSVKFALAAVWLVFTFALASWWLVFGLKQLEDVRAANVSGVVVEDTISIDRQHRMLVSEGGVLLVLLLGGGGALLYNILVESRRARQVEEFFASFTHDLKTSLASLRIQTESLRDELESLPTEATGPRKLLARIMSDAGRLETQLENALFLADADKSSMLLEPVSTRELIASLAHLWPRMSIQVHRDAAVLVDRRALESIVRNIAQNSVRHGQATRLDVYCDEGATLSKLKFVDDGRGFRGNVKRLGEIFSRQTGMSGSGIGLYLVARLVERMGGRAKVETSVEDQGRGFAVEIEIPTARREGRTA